MRAYPTSSYLIYDMLRTPTWELMEHNPTWCLLLVRFGEMWLVAFPKTKARRKGASGG